MTRALRVLAILGGTFDPIHYGHLRLAADVRSAFSLAEVRLVPAGIPPHRAAPLAAAEHRFAMTALGCAEFPGLTADPREIARAGPSYTVTTLEELHAEQPMLPLARNHYHFAVQIGSCWRQSDQPLAVVSRVGGGLQ